MEFHIAIDAEAAAQFPELLDPFFVITVPAAAHKQELRPGRRCIQPPESQ